MFSIIQETTQKTTIRKPQTLHLSQGQLFQGRVLKFFPNHLASLQLGNMTVTAKLEVPLTAGQKYWLEVVRAEGVPQLKILDDNAVRRDGQQTQAQVLQQLGLPANKVNDLLIRHLATEQIPFTKEVFEKGAQLLQRTGLTNKEGLHILSTLLHRNLPLTLESFYAMRAMERTPGPLLHQITELQGQLQTMQKEHPSLRSFMNGIEAVMKETQIDEGKHPVLQLLHSASSQSVSKDLREGAVQLLQRTGILGGNVSTDQLFENFKAQLMDPSNRQTVSKLWPFLLQNGTGGIPLESLDGKTLFQLLYSRLDQPLTKPEQQQQFQLLLQLFSNNTNAQTVTNNLFNLQSTFVQLSAQEREALSHLWNQSVQNEQQGERSSIANQLIRIVNGLGYSQERELLQFFQGQNSANENSQGERLKGLLLQLNQIHLPKTMKDKVESVIYRITGQQLIAQEQQGPIQQTALQVPLQLGEWLTELTVQWEGKRKADGKIDPDHCRILFYLNLAQLRETVVDVQIQKKIISVQVFNEHERPVMLLNVLQPLLKKQLSKMEYTLSSVNWIQFTEQQFKKDTSAHKAYTHRNGYEGVDVRV
ncbi:hypothetical protein [Alkalihalobacterium sp. APHAB7]|uniref:hypothetical protein n=1 Tax=Alkalihalobacterium sp. APHAB7 TaxID=3402081 RepID=UPI003AABF747